MSNLYRQFLDLLPPRPLQVGTVTATDGSTCTIQLPGGGVLQALARNPSPIRPARGNTGWLFIA